MTDSRREMYIQRLGYLTQRKRIDRLLPVKFLDQLDRCRDDDFRKVLLGITDMFPKPKDSQVFPKSVDEKIAIRKSVYLRDKCRCVKCGKPVILERGFWNSMHLSHIKSKGSGGDWHESNLETLCLTCHGTQHNGGKPCPPKGQYAK